MKISQLIKTGIATMLIIALSAAPLEAQNKIKRKPVGKPTTTVTVKKGAVKEVCKDLTVQEFSLKHRKANLSIEYPVSGNAQLVKNLRQWTKDKVYSEYTGTLETPDALMRKCATTLDSYESLDMTISYPYATDKVVTVEVSAYLYSGGAHGMPGLQSETFLCSTGRPLTADMLPSFDKIREYVIAGLMESWELSRSELNDVLFVNPSELSYENSDVYIDSKGLNIRYDVYAIAPYSVGFPTVTIPKAKILPLLSAQAKAYFE